MQRSLSHLMLLAALAAAPNWRCMAETLSLGDIALGSDFTNAVTRLSARGLKIVPVQIKTNPVTASLDEQRVAVAENANGSELWVVHALSGHVIYVERVLQFAPGQEPNTDTTVAGLKQKYGATTTYLNDPEAGRNDLNHQIDVGWYQNRNGQVMPQRGPGHFAVCEAIGGVGVGIGALTVVAFDPREFQEGYYCSQCIEAKLITKTPDFHLLYSVTVGIVDQSAIARYNKHYFAAVSAKTDQQHKEAADRKVTF